MADAPEGRPEPRDTCHPVRVERPEKGLLDVGDPYRDERFSVGRPETPAAGPEWEYVLALEQQLYKAEFREVSLEAALELLYKVAASDLVGYTDCPACQAHHDETGRWWSDERNGHGEDCPRFPLEEARAALAEVAR